MGCGRGHVGLCAARGSGDVQATRTRGGPLCVHVDGECLGRLVKRAGLEGEYGSAEVSGVDVGDVQELCVP